MTKRLRYEAGYGEDDWVHKCMSCQHSYTKINESDTLFCYASKMGECKYKPLKENLRKESSDTKEYKKGE